jgi:hypothetical protein
MRLSLGFASLLFASILQAQAAVAVPVSGDPGVSPAQLPAPATLSISGVSGAPVVYPGATLNLQMVLTNSAGWNISGLGFTVWTPALNLAAGTASTAAQKTLWASPTTSLLIGFTQPGGSAPQVASNVPYSDGQVLTFSYSVPSTVTTGSTLAIAIPTPVDAADINGAPVAVTVVPLALTVGVNPTCIATANADESAWAAAAAGGNNAQAQVLLGNLVSYLGTVVAGTCK